MELSTAMRDEIEGRIVALDREAETYAESLRQHERLQIDAALRRTAAAALRAEYAALLDGGF